MPDPIRSYIICCTPRSGSHLLAEGLFSSGIAGRPTERFPRSWLDRPLSREELDALVTKPPPEESYDVELDASYIREVKERDTTPNGVFGTTIHWVQLHDAIRRSNAYAGKLESNPHTIFSSAFPNLSYIWLRRQDRIAQAVSWHKAIQTGRFVHLQGEPESDKKATFDYQKIRTYVSALTSWDNAWKHFFRSHRITPILVNYEELALEFPLEIERVLRKLDLIVNESVAIGLPENRRAADGLSMQWIERFRAMERTASRKV